MVIWHQEVEKRLSVKGRKGRIEKAEGQKKREEKSLIVSEPLRRQSGQLENKRGKNRKQKVGYIHVYAQLAGSSGKPSPFSTQWCSGGGRNGSQRRLNGR